MNSPPGSLYIGPLHLVTLIDSNRPFVCIWTMDSPALPQEIIHEILSNIPTRDLCNMLTTSKAVYLDVKGILHSRLETHLRENGDHKLLVLPRSNLPFPLTLISCCE